MNIEITPMTAENVGVVSLLAKANLKEGWSEQTYLAQLSNPNDRTYIAYIDGVPCGFISAWIILDEIEINNIAVAPEYRRRGVAKALFTRLYSDEAAARAKVSTDILMARACKIGQQKSVSAKAVLG